MQYCGGCWLDIRTRVDLIDKPEAFQMLSAHVDWTLCVHKGTIVWETEAGLVLLLLDYISLEKGNSHGGRTT